MTPPTVPGYRLLRYLGGGAVFEVWEARATDDVIPVAIKFPRPESAENRTARILLRREARAGTAVRHPRLIRVIESRVTHEPPCVVFQYVPGDSLQNRIKRRGRLTVRAAVWAVRQAAEGMAALHRAGLVHADVKPGNILVNGTGEATLVDLGFAHRPGENRKLFRAGYVMGTANYLAPEMCRRPPREGPAADVFALGVTLFECLTGRLPYPPATAEETMKYRRAAEPMDLGSVPGPWPEAVVEVVRGMLAMDPRTRPSAARVVRQLVRVEINELRTSGGRPVAVR